MPLRRLLVVVGLTALAGCQSNATTELESVRADYHAGEYADTHERAEDLAQSTSGPARDEALYLAGISAYRMGDLGEAERRLLIAADSSDPTTAANAKASLGLIRLDQNRPDEAARLFQEASTGLASEDLHRAERYAVAARRRARGADPDDFSLQIGAFRDRRRAERAAGEASRDRAARRLGSARVIPRERNGDRLYFVQIGRFDSRQQAARERDRIGRREYIVAATLQ